MDIVMAMGTYSDFINITNELIQAEDISFKEMLRSCNELNIKSEDLFCKLNKEAVDKIHKHVNEEDEINYDFCDAYDDLTIFEFFDI